MPIDRAQTHPADAPCPARLCPACGAADAIAAGEPVWPPGRPCPACGQVTPSQDGVALLAPALADTMSGFDPAAFAALAAMEPGHFWFEPRNRLLGTLVARLFPRAGSILEIGCGTGFVLQALRRSAPQARLVGSELHPSGLKLARQRLGAEVECVQMDARHIAASGAFDLIGAFDVLEHIEEDVAVIRSMRGALRPGGGVLVAVPQHPWLWSAADDVAHHARRYRRGELEGKLRAAGFRVTFSGSYCALTLPLMMASRWAERLRRRSGTPPKASAIEARPGRLLNTLLRGVLQAEVTTTLAGMRYPLGGSRIVAAVRQD